MAEPTDWRAVVGKLAWHLGQDHFPPGQLAMLRRIDPAAPHAPTFWQLLAEHADAAFEQPRACHALAAVLRGMAVAHPFHWRREGRQPPLGVAMAEAGVSEARLLRLLRLNRQQLPEELRRLARLMASKGDAGRFDWADAFDLLFWQDGEPIRRRVARDYYRQQYRLDHSPADMEPAA